MNRWIARARHVLRRWRRPAAHEQALDDELQAYVGTDIASRVRAGDTPEEARRQALIALGGFEQVKEQVRNARTGAGLEGVRQDLRYAVRSLSAHLGFGGSVVGSVALGMSAMIAGLAFANAILLRETPGVRTPARLVEFTIAMQDRGLQTFRPTLRDVSVMADGFRETATLAAAGTMDVSVALPEPAALHAAIVTDNYFDVLGARLEIGDAIRPPSTGVPSPHVAVITYRLWATELGGDRAIVGRTIHVGGIPVQIAGVASADFLGVWEGPGGFRPDLWLPVALADRLAAAASTWTPNVPTPERRFRSVVGVLQKPDGLIALQASSGSVAAQLQAVQQTPVALQIGAAHLGDQVRQWWGPLAKAAMAVPVLVLLIACMNAANLLLARGTSRAREIAIRLAIGASRGRVVRQLLFESALLAIASTLVAVPLTVVGLRVAGDALRLAMPLDGTVIALTLASVVISAIGFGLAPALRATRQLPSHGLRQTHRGDVTPRQSRTRRAIVVVQVAVSLILLSLGSQLIASFRSLEPAAGTPSDQLLVASFDLRQMNVAPAQAERFYAAVLERVAALPEVEAAGIAGGREIWFSAGWGRGAGGLYVRHAPFGPNDGRESRGGYAGGDLFAALGLRVLSGRVFAAEDRQRFQPQVAVVTQAYADRVLHGRAVGEMLEISRDATSARMRVQIVGVVESPYDPSGHEGNQSAACVFVPVTLVPSPGLSLFARSRTSAEAIMPRVRDVVRAIDPRASFTQFGSLADVNRRGDEKLAFVVSLSWVATVLGGMALALAGWGLYAVMSHLVALRGREFAVRLSLGARTSDVLGMVAGQAARLAAIGAAIGMFAAILTGISIQANWRSAPSASVFGVALSALALAAVMLLAALVPATRASRVDPMVLLKDG